ncbi:hypothetical protein CYMTET_51963 [Cymbomonas tetramitiformis]|uniref:F-box domain-containing protein n=1 Tax=Cymbomonas tetramitiformis TaxID=36881 RepID=A0AAE0BL96_9CHLO|nr:hypothetical protein CYMTET_51963 [Cymbomonas tetramitiformis]
MSAPPEILPLEVIVHILQFLPFPGRQQASQVCRRWRHASSDPCFTIRVSPRPRAISAAISSAPEGATIVLSPGYYQETVLVCKPVRILGETTETAAGGSRLGVVVEGHASTAIVCSAFFSMERVRVRARRAAPGRSIITYHHGGTCPFISLKHCEISGGSNLRLPNINPPGRLLLTNTCINSTAARDYAIHIGGGTAAIRGCTITGNRGAGVGIAQGAHASITNNDVSFNGRAGIFVAGSGTIRDNIIWGNRGHSIDIDAGHVWGSCTFSNNHVKKRDVLTAEDHLRTSFLEHMHANIQELPPELPLDPNQGVGNVLEEAAVAMNVGGLLELVQGAALAAAAAGNDVVGDIQALQQQQHGADAHEEDEEDNEEEDEDEDENEEEDDEEPQGAGDVAAMDEEAAPFLHNVSHIAQIIMGGGGPPYQ